MPPVIQDLLSPMVAASAAVAVLLWLTRHGSTLVAGGATAALSVPTLLLLALRQGPDFARLAACGTLLTTPACAVLAALGLRWLDRCPPRTGPHAPRGIWRTVVLAGLVSGSVCAGARLLGPLGSGFVGGLPWVAGWTLLGTQRHSGAEAARHYVAAYRRALWPRGAVVLVFALLAVPLGAAGALGCAVAVGAVLLARVPSLQTAAAGPAGRLHHRLIQPGRSPCSPLATCVRAPAPADSDSRRSA